MIDQKAWILLDDEPVFYGPMYNKLIHGKPDRIAGVVLLPSTLTKGKGVFVKELKYRWGFYGVAGFFYAVYRMIKSKILRSGDVRRSAMNADIPVFNFDTLKEAIPFLEEKQAFIVLASTVRKVPTPTLQTTPGGWVNTHCGPLPRYAGQNAPFWCLYDNEPQLTVTLHYMSQKYDAGPIIDQRSINNDGTISYFHAVDRLFNLAAHMFLNFIDDFSPTIADSKHQDANKRTQVNKPTIEDGKLFRTAGGKFI